MSFFKHGDPAMTATTPTLFTEILVQDEAAPAEIFGGVFLLQQSARRIRVARLSNKGQRARPVRSARKLLLDLGALWFLSFPPLNCSLRGCNHPKPCRSQTESSRPSCRVRSWRSVEFRTDCRAIGGFGHREGFGAFFTALQIQGVFEDLYSIVL